MAEPDTPWLDPRPEAGGIALAPRAPLGAGRRLLLLDNGKIGPPYHHWVPVATALHAVLAGMAEVHGERCDLLVFPVAGHAAQAARWRDAGIQGVVFALGDAGVTQPTMLQAVAAEYAGIPTAVVCTDQTLALAATVAGFLAPGLPVLCLQAGRLADAAALQAAVQALEPELRMALSAEPALLRARAAQRHDFVASLTRPAAPQPTSAADAAHSADTAPTAHARHAAETAHAVGAAASASVWDPALLRREPFADYATAHHLGDGLPLVAPTPSRVACLLAAAGRPWDEVLITTLNPSGAALTVGQAAICAVMAGCTPARFGIVLAALSAMADPAYRLELATITTHPSAHTILVSGPAAEAAGIASGRGCLGPGHAANATIGRAVGLCMVNVARAIPGRSTLCLLGSPAQFTCCFADAMDAPFPPLAQTLAGPGQSIVWVHKAEAPHNVMDHISATPEALLDTFCSVAATLGTNAAYLPSDVLVILNPEHAEVLAHAGWSRPRIQRYLWEHARNPRAALLQRGTKPEWPAEWEGWQHIPIAPAPERFWVVVAGAAGPQSMVALPWGWTRAVWRVLDTPASHAPQA